MINGTNKFVLCTFNNNSLNIFLINSLTKKNFSSLLIMIKKKKIHSQISLGELGYLNEKKEKRKNVLLKYFLHITSFIQAYVWTRINSINHSSGGFVTLFWTLMYIWIVLFCSWFGSFVWLGKIIILVHLFYCFYV